MPETKGKEDILRKIVFIGVSVILLNFVFPNHKRRFSNRFFSPTMLA